MLSSLLFVALARASRALDQTVFGTPARRDAPSWLLITLAGLNLLLFLSSRHVLVEVLPLIESVLASYAPAAVASTLGAWGVGCMLLLVCAVHAAAASAAGWFSMALIEKLG